MVTGSDECAVDPEFARNRQIVKGIANQENGVGRIGETPHEIAAEGNLAVGMDVVETCDMIEVRGDAEVAYDFVKGLVSVGREN